jgi:hypothetical protein
MKRSTLLLTVLLFIAGPLFAADADQFVYPSPPKGGQADD